MYVGTKIGFNLAKKFISIPCNLLNLIRALRSVHFARGWRVRPVSAIPTTLRLPH